MRQIKAKNRAERTIDTLEQSLLKAEKSMGKPLEEATYEEILSYLEGLKKYLSDNTVALYLSKFMQFYRFCFDETEDIKYNKLLKKLQKINTGIKRKYINPQDILLPEDVKRLINVATLERDRCIVATLFESGMRRGELLALTNNMVLMEESKQEVTFNIPEVEGCKTGGRTVVCLEIYGYVQDWMKCNKSEMFMPISENGLKRILISLFDKSGLNKPYNPHWFRHSAITHAVNIGMQHSAISMRFWGSVNSDMLEVYIHLSEQMQANAYRNAKGMNGNETKVINPLSCRCVNCGRLIQTGSLCKTCEDSKKLSKENIELKADIETMKSMFNEDAIKVMIETRIAEILKKG